MDKLIHLSDACDLMEKYASRNPDVSSLCYDIRYGLMRLPTISPDEVRGAGEWICIPGFHLDHEYYPARYQCDQCKHFVDSGDDRNYCPNCGAKMKGAEDETTDNT